MKKFFFFAAIAAIGLASCSNDETIASQATSESNAISFRPLATNMTRAADITTTNLTSFFVTANIVSDAPVTNYFGGTTPVEYSDANVGTGEGKHASTAGTYTSATKYYWPSTGKLDFIAFAPAVGTDITRTDSTQFSVTPNVTPSAQQDFLYAVVRNQTKAANGTGVVLNFRHALSKIVIQLKNTSSDLHFTVRNVAIGNILPTGAFAPVYKTEAGSQIGFSTNGTLKSNTTVASETGYYITNEAWVASGTATSYTQTAGTTAYSVNYTSPAALTNDMILIPQALTVSTAYTAQTPGTPAAGDTFNGAYISVELKIQDASNHYIVGTSETDGYVTAMWPLTALTWLPGHRYTYTVDLKDGGYYTTNQGTTDDNLDPILDNSEIKFVNVTIDEWTDATGISVPEVTP